MRGKRLRLAQLYKLKKELLELKLEEEQLKQEKEAYKKLEKCR